MRVGQRLEQNRIHCAEDRCAGTDAERQRAYADDREPSVAAQLPHRVANIGSRGSHCVLPPIGTHFLANNRRVPYFQPCGSLRLLNGEPTRPAGGSRFFEVLLYLIGNILVDRRSMDKAAQAVGQLTPERHATNPRF
jgi:hypothetical protein